MVGWVEAIGVALSWLSASLDPLAASCPFDDLFSDMIALIRIEVRWMGQEGAGRGWIALRRFSVTPTQLRYLGVQRGECGLAKRNTQPFPALL